MIRFLCACVLVNAGSAAGGNAQRCLPGQRVPSSEQLAQDEIADKKLDEQIKETKRPWCFPTGELYFRISELYWEKFCILERRELASAGVGVKPDHRESALYRNEVMRLYEMILREYPAYERSDEILFNLSYNLSFIGKTKQALRRYDELIRTHPSSNFAPEAHLQRGNLFCKEGKFPKARSAYEHVLVSGGLGQGQKARALSMLGWCDFSAGEGERALKRFEQVVALCEANDEHQALEDLRSEALRGFAAVSVKLGRIDEARAYLSAHAREPELTSLMSQLDERR